MDIYERYGRATEALEQEREQHIRTIALLRCLKNGTHNLAQVEVGDDNSWSLSQPTFNVVIEKPNADDLGQVETPEGGLSADEATAIAEKLVKAAP